MVRKRSTEVAVAITLLDTQLRNSATAATIGKDRQTLCGSADDAEIRSSDPRPIPTSGTERLFLFRGESLHPHSTSDGWRKRIKAICKKLGIMPAHPHRFRHSLATDLLSKGATIEQVAAILGNSPAVVIKHYSLWIRSRQDALDAFLTKAWDTKLVRVK